MPQKFLSKVCRVTKMPIYFIDTNSDRSSIGDILTTNISFVLKFLTKLCAHFKNSKHSIVSNFYFKYSCCIYYFYDLQYNFLNSFKGTSVDENHV